MFAALIRWLLEGRIGGPSAGRNRPPRTTEGRESMRWRESSS